MSDITALASAVPVAVASVSPVAQLGGAVAQVVSEHANEIASIGVAVVLVIVDGLVDRFITRVPWLRVAWSAIRGRAGDAAEKAAADGLRKIGGGK